MMFRAPLLALGLFSLIPSAAHAQNASYGSMEARSAEIARVYLRVWSNDAGTSIGAVPYIYGPRVRFYGRNYSQGDLMAEKRRAVARWPVRDYHHRPGTLRVICNQRTRKCAARSIIDYSVANPARGTSARGSSSFDLGISFAGPQPVILYESGGRAGR